LFPLGCEARPDERRRVAPEPELPGQLAVTVSYPLEGTPAPGLVKKRVVVVDDHRLSAGALADSLGVRGVEVVAVEHNGSAGYRACVTHRPDALLVDFDLGLGPTGADLAIKVREVQPRIGILMFTAYEDPKLLSGTFPSLPATVVYLVKQHVHEVDDVVLALGAAIESASAGKLPLERVHRFPLTRAQAQVLRLVAKGMSNQAIAEELVVSLPTVASGIRRLAKKFDIGHGSGSNVRVQLTQKYFDYVGFQREQG
jgi:DNA-binding NarL/FixJ family response regulator